MKLKEIGKKREKKLKISVQEIENEIEQLLKDYDIDTKVQIFIESKLDKILNFDEIKTNLKLKTPKNYKYQFGNELFTELYDYLYPLIENACNDSLKKAESISKEVHQHKEIIYNNIFNIVELTMYKNGIHKLKLVAFHYLLKALEKRSKTILKQSETTTVRGYKVPIEVFSFEITDIIAKNPDLEKFTLTLKSVIEQWLIKYNNKTKIGQFYYSILMINQDYIIEKILRYLMFTAIKNMNPIKLRAIFSTYITLIHKNIFSFYALKLSDIKVGHFSQLDVLFEENMMNNTEIIDNNKILIQSFLLSTATKNKRLFKNNSDILFDEYCSNFLDLNYYDFLYGYDQSMHLLDYQYYYSIFLKYLKNTFRTPAKFHKLKNTYKKPSIKKALKNYAYDLIIDKFFKTFYTFFKDEETAKNICEKISNDLLKKINQNSFLDKNFKPVIMVFDEYLSHLNQIVQGMTKLKSA